MRENLLFWCRRARARARQANPTLGDSLRRTKMINYPTNRTEALARLSDEKERDAAEKSFNYVIFAKLGHYLNAKVCALGEATSLPSTKQRRSRPPIRRRAW